MQEFMRKFEQLNGKMAKITLNHCLFGKQVIYCDSLQTIHDERIIGLVLKNQSVYVYKQHMKTMEIDDNHCEIADDRLIITINVNK